MLEFYLIGHSVLVVIRRFTVIVGKFEDTSRDQKSGIDPSGNLVITFGVSVEDVVPDADVFYRVWDGQGRSAHGQRGQKQE